LAPRPKMVPGDPGEVGLGEGTGSGDMLGDMRAEPEPEPAAAEVGAGDNVGNWSGATLLAPCFGVGEGSIAMDVA